MTTKYGLKKISSATIQDIMLNEEQFNCLEHFMDVKADVIVIESKRAWEDLLFCFDETDKKVFLEIMPEYVRFVNNHDNQFICQ